MHDYLVVGAGLAGCTMAERLVNGLRASVLIVDVRDHISGNTYDPRNQAGVRIHQYGPHVFHTNASKIVDYLSRFTTWIPYEHRVLARVAGQLLPIPINRTTLNKLYSLDLDEAGAERFLRERAEPKDLIVNSEEVVKAKVGRELYELFFRGYTRKQWGIDPSALDAGVCGRIPIRYNDDDRYFSDDFQKMPSDGYYEMCKRMLEHPDIEIRLSTSYQDIADPASFKHIFYTGPIDEYFNYCFGRLPYRSLKFTFETLEGHHLQPVGCINEPSEDVPYTRTTEYGHLTGEWGSKTVLSREYPSSEGDPFYPIPRQENRDLYKKYQDLAATEQQVTFIGRLAEYRYYNMDQVIASALTAFDRFKTKIV
jgi:UDP-galactopyranose mutase